MQFDTVNKNKQNIQSSAIKGYLLNNYIKKDDISNQEDSFEYILQSSYDNNLLPDNTLPKKSAFNTKKALKPIAILTGATIVGIVGVSACIAKYSNHLAKDERIIRPPDVPRCMNILEEYHLAMYRALRDPNALNVIGLGAVGAFSALALSAKTFVDSAKEVWIKKQNCDIDYDLQENLIEVEKDAFSGKLNVVNTLLNNTADYFRNSLDKNKKDIEFKQFLSFKGNKKDEDKENKDSKAKPLFIGALGILGFCSILFLTFKNYQKMGKNVRLFMDNVVDSAIKDKLSKGRNEKNSDKAMEELIKVFKSVNINPQEAERKLSKVEGITDKEISTIIEKLKSEQEHIFAQAPEALGGVTEKIQYYCYVNEERGHLYNWILNPENKWNKYLFLSFCFVSSIGYLARSAADAVKQVAVSRENSKSELNLRKRLVAVEINNFKAKKLSAIKPMIDNYNYQKQKGKSKEELTALAQNILLEIKNGPPYIYN